MTTQIIIIVSTTTLGLCAIAKVFGHHPILGLAWSLQVLSFAAIAYGCAVAFSLL